MIRRMFRSLRIPALAAALLLGALAHPAGACPNCKDLLPNGPGEAAQAQPPVARGYYYSILFMLAVPYTLIGALGVGFWYVLRKDAAAARAATTKPAQ